MPFDLSGDWVPPTTVHPLDLHSPLPSGHSYESLVPPVTTLTPGELLDRYYNNRQNGSGWTDPKGILRNQWEVSKNHLDNVGTPIGSPGLVGKWERPNGLSAVPVPVRRADSLLDGSQVVVEFKYRGQEGPSTGPHVATLCGDRADPTKLQGADDIVLDDLKGSVLDFVIALEWPGYRHEQFSIRVVSENGGPMTRFDLGEQLSIAYAMFFRKVEKESRLPSAAGFYNIALHQGKNWRPGSLGIQFMQLHLVRFRNTIGGRWVADVEIV